MLAAIVGGVVASAVRELSPASWQAELSLAIGVIAPVPEAPERLVAIEPWNEVREALSGGGRRSAWFEGNRVRVRMQGDDPAGIARELDDVAAKLRRDHDAVFDLWRASSSARHVPGARSTMVFGPARVERLPKQTAKAGVFGALAGGVVAFALGRALRRRKTLQRPSRSAAQPEAVPASTEIRTSAGA